jgi:hypothetical protein
MKRVTWLLLTLVTVLAGCASVQKILPISDAARQSPPPEAAWSRVLTRHVDDQGRVQFEALAQDRADLDTFVAYVNAVSPASEPGLFPSADHVLAYHLNAYNALAMHQVLAAGIPKSLSGFNKIRFFYLNKVRVGGELTTLYAYENEVIRPLGGARVHVALNCMSVSCPRLPREPFSAATLQAQLEREAKHFYNEPRNVVVNASQKTAALSEILSFYTADFLAEAPSLLAYVNRYRDSPVPEDWAVVFAPYDWTVNRQP